jgi:hypothetical protein
MRDTHGTTNATVVCYQAAPVCAAYTERGSELYLQEAPIQLALHANTAPWIMVGYDIKPFWEMVLLWWSYIFSLFWERGLFLL